MKFSLQSHSINSNSAHPQVDIRNHIWENEMPFPDRSDASHFAQWWDYSGYSVMLWLTFLSSEKFQLKFSHLI